MIWYMYTHGGTKVEILFLEIICSVSKLDLSIRFLNQVSALLLDIVHKIRRSVVLKGNSGHNEWWGRWRIGDIVTDSN